MPKKPKKITKAEIKKNVSKPIREQYKQPKQDGKTKRP